MTFSTHLAKIRRQVFPTPTGRTPVSLSNEFTALFTELKKILGEATYHKNVESGETKTSFKTED